MTTTTAPKGKLDAVVPVGAAVNGPEGERFDWETVDWSSVEASVRRLRQRIFTASRAGDLKKVRNLQKLMLRSWANTLLSVRRTTQVNAGRKTAGIDGRVALHPEDRADLARWVHHEANLWTARPVKRVFIPKAGGKQRPLGIPVIVDRVLQAQVVNALEPEWEAKFEPKSYGFRPGRGCHDAIGAIYQSVRGPRAKRLWALDADLKAAFDRIDHQFLLTSLGNFPAREAIAGWLKAGVVDKGRWSPTEEGTPQGGVVSPLLLNIALHGLEQAAGVRYRQVRSNAEVLMGHPLVVRYADDFVVLCHSRDEAEEVKARLAEWLTPRGLAFNEDKTAIARLEDGFDFLGFNVRRYRDKLLIKPSDAAVRRIRHRLRTETRALRGANVAAIVGAINPIVRGWAAYYRTAVSSQVFSRLDHYLWQLTYRWALRRHPNKPKRWIVSRYFGQFNPSRRTRWVFGDRDSGAYLLKFRWTKIVRHQMVIGSASVDDPALTDYWNARRRRSRSSLPVNRLTLGLLQAQHGRCGYCDDLLLHADTQPQSPQQWEQWLRGTRKAMSRKAIVSGDGGPDDQPRLVHAHCRRRTSASRRPAPQETREPVGLA
ncbi:group II intron reverse transcriptase/maturase [Micromonospora sp. DT48]|uniref:group II intron reverse transcriptase/maturase n=1 Tax=Micromonospora sp. DT48 TaxID=3393429 RepID=UPI003CF4E890